MNCLTIILIYFIFFIFGLIFGSFLNCLVYRLANDKKISGRSFCPKCKTKIKWFDNIPLISFLFLKGRCRACQEKISWQYPLIELTMGLLFLLPLLKANLSLSGFLFEKNFIIEIFQDWLIYFVLVFTFIYDIKYLEVSDLVIFSSGALILILNLFLKQNHILAWLKPTLFAMLVAFLFFLLQYLFTKGKGIGLGDLRIGLFMGLVLGHWRFLFLALVFAYLIGSFVSLALIVLKKKSFKSQIPLGPFLTIGTFLTLFFGEKIINFYF